MHVLFRKSIVLDIYIYSEQSLSSYVQITYDRLYKRKGVLNLKIDTCRNSNLFYFSCDMATNSNYMISILFFIRKKIKERSELIKVAIESLTDKKESHVVKC